ncbi:MarR family transcriptional regulator [Gallibacterium anatis]|uniref:MarR family transcriptional regulator n=3 Tax=Gallibacterium anatis TaxID=750 RepID=A0AAX3XE06_9PAST|nr:MarR family transcriptional regulator [Gallibacterium anatis]MDK9429580.1 MarR family transcriptional regulator [Gallibacterium anatis]MDK9561146.1 MarR family transcriptional regulator [Gallibacterium anatis]WIM80429.1 MarR family transcriptional regulator [Gallibacterium anatis]WIM85189.1 MarR family transcriptional regulator [Gallibacterium anatis]WKS96217.1 MarR family transcriptional regulator [Gallibacterium anatis]
MMNKLLSDTDSVLKMYAEDFPNMPLDQVVLVRLLFNVNSNYLEHRNHFLKEVGLNHTLFEALIVTYLQPNHEIQPSHLSEILGSSRTNATRISDELVDKGLIDRISVPEDRRCFSLRINEKGLKFLQDILPHQWELMGSIFSVLTDKEIQTLRKLLLKLSKRLDEYRPHRT